MLRVDAVLRSDDGAGTHLERDHPTRTPRLILAFPGVCNQFESEVPHYSEEHAHHRPDRF